jgi:hypothetical protein
MTILTVPAPQANAVSNDGEQSISLFVRVPVRHPGAAEGPAGSATTSIAGVGRCPRLRPGIGGRWGAGYDNGIRSAIPWTETARILRM